MELMLDLHSLGVDEAGKNENEAHRAEGGLPGTLRIVLALAAVAAAWFVLANPLPGEIVRRIMRGISATSMGTVPGSIGTLLASLPGA